MLTKTCGGIGQCILTGLSRFSFNEPKGSRFSRTRGRLTDTGTKAGEHEAKQGAICLLRSNTNQVTRDYDDQEEQPANR